LSLSDDVQAGDDVAHHLLGTKTPKPQNPKTPAVIVEISLRLC
jgi:hypothetical protein